MDHLQIETALESLAVAANSLNEAVEVLARRTGERRNVAPLLKAADLRTVEVLALLGYPEERPTWKPPALNTGMGPVRPDPLVEKAALAISRAELSGLTNRGALGSELVLALPELAGSGPDALALVDQIRPQAPRP